MPKRKNVVQQVKKFARRPGIVNLQKSKKGILVNDNKLNNEIYLLEGLVLSTSLPSSRAAALAKCEGADKG